MKASELAKYIDHTLLKPDASAAQIKKICDEAKEYHFASVCVNPSRIRLVADELAGSGVTPCCVVGFPLGAIPSESKAAETAVAVKNGAGTTEKQPADWRCGCVSQYALRTTRRQNAWESLKTAGKRRLPSEAHAQIERRAFFSV